MQVQPSFWRVFRRLCAQYRGHDETGWTPVGERVDTVLASPPGDRDAAVAALFEALAAEPDALDLAFWIGTRMPLTACGAHSLALLAAPTAGHALQWIADTPQPGLPLIACRYDTDAECGRLGIEVRRPLSDAATRLVLALGIAFLDRLLRRLTGVAGPILAVHLPGPAAGRESGYWQHLSILPEVGAARTAVLVPRAVLDAENPAADRDTFESLRDALGMPAVIERHDDALRDRVRELILAHLAVPMPQQRLAQRLGLSPRQLRQGLQREGTSYQAQVRQCRAEFASRLMPHASLSEIAERLGYSELSAFSHAFYRWTGRSPSDFRDQLRARTRAVDG